MRMVRMMPPLPGHHSRSSVHPLRVAPRDEGKHISLFLIFQG